MTRPRALCVSRPSPTPLTPVLELYAIEIQMYSDLKETRKLKVGFVLDDC